MVLDLKLTKSSQICLFLDYDGTLASLARTPADAKMKPEMRATLDRLTTISCIAVAIVSGRSIEDLRSMLSYERITYAGNHGLEIEIPGKRRFLHPDVEFFKNQATKLAEALNSMQEIYPGTYLELKGPSLTFHYRNADVTVHGQIHEAAAALISSFGFQPRPAIMAVEALPPIGWDKGRATHYILRSRYGIQWSTNVQVIYIGDDHTDEDAFRMLSGLAATFRVGDPSVVSAATHRLLSVESVHRFLEYICSRVCE
eukprot:TRINITY_DN12747_c0_g1_i3.p1 TRINITY_DN12747_c0_g1~~TRINITY_DN12747_c0_g1_i3.p1  ORF type:complete len:257 (-),score=13.05 TRINITY_DN12747_c0_g1_i3:76-846(-)